MTTTSMSDDMLRRVNEAREAARRAVVHSPTIDAAKAEEKWNRLVRIRPEVGSLSRSGLRTVPLADGSGPAMRRDEIFQLASKLTAKSSKEVLSDFVVNVNAWGYGPTGYGTYRTKRLIEAENFDARARTALELLRDLGGVDAYYYLRNAGKVASWGPAFFTKFLYFGDPRNQPGQDGGALILDAVLGNQIHAIAGAKVDDKPVVAGTYRFRNWSWTTPEDALYLELMQRIATDKGVRTDRVEAASFAAERKRRQSNAPKQ